MTGAQCEPYPPVLAHGGGKGTAPMPPGLQDPPPLRQGGGGAALNARGLSCTSSNRR